MGWFDWLFKKKKRPQPPAVPVRTVAVTVFRAGKRPVAGATVRLDQRPIPFIGQTNQDGYVAFPQVPEGLRASHLDIHHGGSHYSTHVDLSPGNHTLRVGESKRDPGDIELPAFGGGGLSGDPLQVRTDFLTLRHPDNPGEILYPGPYPAYDDTKRQRLREAMVRNGYTHYWIDTVFARQSGGWLDLDGYDYLDRPQEFRRYLTELREAGLHPLVVIGFEENPAADAKYRAQLIPAFQRFVREVDDLVSVYMLGVEVREYWSWDETLDVIAGIGAVSETPILVHQNQRKWGPDREDPWKGRGGMEMTWWREAKARAPRTQLGLAFQGGHGRWPGGFLSSQEELVRDIKGFLDPTRLGGIGVLTYAAEYAHRAPEDRAKALGAAALAAGAAGFMNGGPGLPR